MNLKTNQLNQISTLKGTNEAAFSSNYKFSINFHSDANTPFTITLNDNNGKLLKVLEDNKKLNKKMDDYDLVEKTFLKFQIKKV